MTVVKASFWAIFLKIRWREYLILRWIESFETWSPDINLILLKERLWKLPFEVNACHPVYLLNEISKSFFLLHFICNCKNSVNTSLRYFQMSCSVTYTHTLCFLWHVIRAWLRQGQLLWGPSDLPSQGGGPSHTQKFD